MKKIIVVGGGIAGLSAGIYALKAGFSVEIFEKNPVAGGQCMGWNRKGHHIDNCIHWLTGTKKGTGLRALWEEIGALERNTEFVQSDKFYTSFMNGESATLWKDLDRTQEELTRISPIDKEEIQEFISYIRYASCCEMPVEKPMDMMGIKDYITMGKKMKNMPKVMKRYGNISIGDMAEKFQHPLLKALFTDYMPKDYKASSFIVSYATIVSENGEVPLGGSLLMTNRIINKFKSLGGVLHCASPVKKICVEGKIAVGIEQMNGNVVKADYIISTTDTMELFEKLIGVQFMDTNWKNSYGDSDNYPLFSGFQAAFSVDKSAYKEEGTVFFDCNPFQIGTKEIKRMSVKSFEYEPDWAPKGKIVLQSNVMQMDEDYIFWRSLNKDEYVNKKLEYTKIIKERIESKFADLKGKIEILDIWTPLTYVRYCNAYHGAYMSFITKKDVKSFYSKGMIKGLSNVFIASQWNQAPGGLPVAAAAGKFAIQRILKAGGLRNMNT